MKAGSVDEGLGNATGGTTATTAATGGTGQSAANMVGTMPSPCGPGHATGATDKGVTPTTIKIGVISDKNGSGGITVPTVGIQGSMQAFVAYCNSLGGVRGRKLQLVTFDSKLFQENEAMKQACSSGIFALVGSGSVADDQGAQTMVDCKLVEVAGLHRHLRQGPLAPGLRGHPEPGQRLPHGPGHLHRQAVPRRHQEGGDRRPDPRHGQEPGQAHGAGHGAAGLQSRPHAHRAARHQLGADRAVAQGQGRAVPHGHHHGRPDGADAQGHEGGRASRPQVVDLAQQYYDPALASSGVAEGAYVLTNTQPFEEPNAAIDLYNQWLKKAGGGRAPTTLGVESFSAGLLFAKVAGSLGSHLTRDNLITGLTQGHLVGRRRPAPEPEPRPEHRRLVVLYLQVKGGKFVRAFPDKGFSCNTANTAHVSGDFGKVPVEK